MEQVLIIDDDELVRFTLREIMETFGHQVTEARNGREGIAIFKTGQFDIILTDIVMPEMDGIEVIQEIRQRDMSVPIIAISGSGGAFKMQHLEIARKAGATKIMSKPFKPDELINAVEECLPAE
ncbi:response regulator [Pseudomonadota bacterium]